MKRLFLFTAAILCLSLFGFSCSNKKPTLHLYAWAGYIKPSLLKKFEEKQNCFVNVDTFDSNEAMYAKLKAGASGYDLIIPSSYFVQIMKKQGMLQEIDFSKIPNLKYLDREAVSKTAPLIENYGVPYMIGYTGVGYRKDRIKDIKHSWNVFGDASFKGRMTMLNDAREVLGSALKYLGYSINTTSKSELKQATDLVVQWKKFLAKFESEQYKNGLATAEYLLSQGYSSDVVQIEQADPLVGFFIPEEGTVISVDYFVIPKGARQTDLALALIDFLNEPKIAAENMEKICSKSPNKAAYEYLSPFLKNNPALFPSKETLEKSEILEDLGTDIKLYHKAWDDIKNAD